MITPAGVDSALKQSGFEVLETRDAALDPNPGGIPWYQPLTPSWNVFTQRFQFTWLGMRLTKAALYVMEMVRATFHVGVEFPYLQVQYVCGGILMLYSLILHLNDRQFSSIAASLNKHTGISC